MLFLDPFAETQTGERPGEPPADPSSDLAALLDGWGVAFDPAQAVADPAHAIRTTRTVGGRRQEVANPAWLALGPEAMDHETPALARLSSLVMTTAAAFSAAEDGPTLTPLVTASPDAALADAATAADGFADPRRLLTDATAPETPPALAARITGALRSAFPEGAPEGSDWTGEHVAEAAQANILLVGDADMLMDRNWIQRRSILGASVPQAFANNGDFLLNAAEQMAGGAALADLRGRAVAWRPLERIDDLRRAAEAEYRETEQRLLARIREAEDKLRDLAPPEGEDGALFAEEAVAEADALRADLLAARAELRRVRYELRRDVDALKGWVTTAHVGAVPALAALAALGVALRRPCHPLPKRAA